MTSFACRVYKAVMGIPLGQVRTYKWVARKAGSSSAYRAVGTALRNNPLPLVIPCHRVVRGNNVLGGYIFGKDFKKRILRLEKEIASCLTNKK